MYRTISIVSILLVSMSLVGAQSRNGVVMGTVRIESEVQEPAVGATVVLEETAFGASTDPDGRFTIRDVPAGIYEIAARLIGYEQTEIQTIGIRTGDTTRVTLILRESIVEFRGVTVNASRIQESGDVRTSLVTLSPRESKYLAGGAEDVLRSIQALPGVSSISDYSAQFAVRGSGPDQNLITIDGFEVLNPYRLYGFTSMFNPETVSDISLQTGGFGAQYGDRLSAVLDVKNREGKTDRLYHSKINLSLTNANVILEGKLPFGASWLVSARRTYYDLVLGPILRSAKLVQGDVALPNFRDVQAKIAVPIDDSNKLVVNAITSRDGVQLVSGAERDQPDSVSVADESYNTLLGGAWQYNPSPGLLARTEISWYRNSGRGFFDGSLVDPSQNTGDLGRADTFGIRFFKFAVDYDFVYTQFSLGQSVVWSLGSNTLEAGLGADVLRTDYSRAFDIDSRYRDIIVGRGGIVPTDLTTELQYRRYNVYAQNRVAVGEHLFLQPGLRFDYHPSLKRKTYLSPRFNASFAVDNLTTLRAAWGLYHQSPGMEKQLYRPRTTYTEETFRDVVAERSVHYILGVDRMVTPEWQFKAEGYYKSFSDVIVPEKVGGWAWSTQRTGDGIFLRSGWTQPVRVPGDSLTPKPVNDATGKAYGVEFMLQKIQALPGDKLNGWINYALSFSERDRGGVRTPFQFDQRHAMNLVLDYRFAERWTVGMNFTVRSGRPFVKALGVRPRVVIEKVDGADVPVVQVGTDGKVVLDVEYERETLTGALDLYHALDLRVTTYPRWWGLQWSLYLDILNVYNRQNQQQIDYYIDDNGALRERIFYGLPIFPSIGMSLSF